MSIVVSSRAWAEERRGNKPKRSATSLLTTLVFLLVVLQLAQSTNAQKQEPRVAVRALFHGGTLPSDTEGGCKVTEFETVKVKIQKHLATRLRRSLQRSGVNCTFLLFSLCRDSHRSRLVLSL
jgi:hypothetical protein